MDFLEDIRKFVLSRLPCHASSRGDLEAKGADELLVIYFNWQERLITPVPRAVHRSQVLSANPLIAHPQYGPAMEQITRKLKLGEDVTPHLSRNVIQGYEVTSKDGADKTFRKDLDLMLNDWGVHHLHLSTDVEEDGFTKRSGPLLFAAIKGIDAYLIDIKDHKSWTCRDILRIMIEEWPDAQLAYPSSVFSSISYTPTETEHETSRQLHINCAFEINGKVYTPRGGLLLSGHSETASEKAHMIIAKSRLAEKVIPKYIDEINQNTNIDGQQTPHNLDIHFKLTDTHECMLIEYSTNTIMSLD